MTLKSRTRNLVVSILFLLLSSCADSINNLSKEIYSAEGFSPVLLAKGKTALTPTIPGSGTTQEAETIGTLLDRAMKKHFTQPGALMEESSVSDQIRHDSALASLWTQMAPHISAHSIRGMTATRIFAQRLGVRYLFETQIQMAEIAGGAEQVRVYARIYDTKQERIVWEGVGEGRGYEKLVFPSTPATFRIVADTAVKGLVDKLYGR
ncbi:MAG: hypothetical protein M0Z25_03900 [Nitrospiraceae bacterium]|nr:hypothetical protein [Nitrospiraceae bacterium]